MSHYQDSDEFHPESKWEEPFDDPRLTLYDQHRLPRNFPTGSTQLSVPVEGESGLDNVFLCSICCGYLQRTMVVPNCLHRFCAECISKSFNQNKRQCPLCLEKIDTLRSLRADTRFDAIIQNILPRAVQQQLHDQVTEQAKKARELYRNEGKKRRVANETSKARARARHAAAARREAEAAVEETDEEEEDEEDEEEEEEQELELPPITAEPSPLVQFELRRHPQEYRVDRLTREWLRLASDATIKILQTFLGYKLCSREGNDGGLHFEILGQVDGESMVLEDHLTLQEIKDNVVDAVNDDNILVLHYRLAA